MGGLGKNSGRVEIFHGGVWGTICGVGWDFEDAEVACRQLGYRGAQPLLDNGTFGPGSGVVWLEGIGCRGNESRLTECGLSGWGESECSHTQDVGVVCEAGTLGVCVCVCVCVCVLTYAHFLFQKWWRPSHSSYI